MNNDYNAYNTPTSLETLTMLALGMRVPSSSSWNTLTKLTLKNRINNQLCMDGSFMQVMKSVPKNRHALGDYFLWDLQTNFIVGTHVDLEVLGQELGVISPDESLVQ